ncbi:MAG: protein kinase domain-containing protein [Hyphomicrobiales bacterium]
MPQTLHAGSKLGPYEIVDLIGAGGMGEVYRARDGRLARDVAVKVLPPAFAADADRLRRFEQEARSAGRINHPNIVAVYDVGAHEGRPYLVTEYLSGETLRQRLAPGPIPVRKAVEIAIALATGLAAAHEQGIVHRDLKPENVFLTTDGRVKILDFGLAKLTRPDVAGDARTGPTAPAATAPADTGPGAVWGTAGYMSPEQVRAQPIDHRSDLFSFGVILYEMLSGRRAFRGESPADTMSAILREDPPDLTTVDGEIPLALERIVRHCIEKSPGERFRSAHDLAFQLENLSSLTGSGPAAGLEAPADGIGAKRETTYFDLLTYRRGPLWSARFAPDGLTILYSAAWDGESARLYMRRTENPDAIPLPLEGVLQAVSRSGEVACLLQATPAHNGVFRGTLAIAPMFGGAPRPVAEAIQGADFGPGPNQVLVVRVVDGRDRIEFPIGTTRYESDGHVSHVRLSPRADRIAFFDHPHPGDDRGCVAVVDLGGTYRALTAEWTSGQGLAWSPDGAEILFTAAEAGSTRSLYAVGLDGSQRFVSGFPGTVRLHDVAPDGRLLLTRDAVRIGLSGKASGESAERDLSWLDWSLVADVSRDGRTVLFDEENEQVGRNYRVCIRGLDGSPVVQLGEGRACALSPDGRWALSVLPTPESPIRLIPTGPGTPREITGEGIRFNARAWWLDDGREVFVLGRDATNRRHLFRIDLETEARTEIGLPLLDEQSISTSRAGALTISRDGATAVVRDDQEVTHVVRFSDGSARRLAGVEPDEIAWTFTDDGRGVFVIPRRGHPWTVHRVDLESGERTPVATLSPVESGGILAVFSLRVALDGEAYVYSYNRVLSELYVVRGLR